MSTLREIQQALAGAILADGAPPEGALRHPRVDPAAAFAIHRRHFVTSLREALAATFPAVVRLVGKGFFAYAAREFVETHPPHSPCLGEYGRDFPDFIAGFGPCAHLAYLPDCARLEWLLHEATSAPIARAVDWSALDPGSYAAAATLGLKLDASLRFLATGWPVDAIVEMARADGDTGALVLNPGDAFLQVRRVAREGRTVRLTQAVFAFRAAVAEGLSIERAFDRATAIDQAFDLTAALAALAAEGVVVGLTAEATEEHP
jgi:hypothetical protein